MPVSSPSPGLLPSATGVETMLSTSPSSGIVFWEPFAATRATVKVASSSAVTRKSAESFRTTSSVPILIPEKEESAGVTTPASVTVEAVTLRPAI